MEVTLLGIVTLVSPVQPENANHANGGDAVGDGHAGQPGAAGERLIADGGDAVGDRHAGQPGAAGEGRITNGGETVGESHAGQPAVAGECHNANGGDRQPLQRAGDSDVAASAGVAGDGDGTVGLGVTELRLDSHRERECQQEEQWPPSRARMQARGGRAMAGPELESCAHGLRIY